MKIIFWLSLFGIFYAYIGYPFVLYAIRKVSGYANNINRDGSDYEPGISIIIPVFNEEKIIGEKIENMRLLNYPEDKLEILIVSDGSTDRTGEIVERKLDSVVKFFKLPERSGKAAALNLGLKEAKNEIIVFSDASIMLDPDALKNIVKKFQNKKIGCISGEDHIQGSGGERFYGKYELFLRHLESKVHSIVGASGSLYAQRSHLCDSFEEGMAPDFLSVLKTVEKGYRAVTEPSAFGTMLSLKKTRDEFNRKVRTLIRGMTALFYKSNLLNPFKFGIFSLELLSHKIMRWLVPFFLVSLFLSNLFLLDGNMYLLFFISQCLFYLTALIAVLKYMNFNKKLYGNVALYFTTVNAAILYAWFKYLSGVRQDIWDPSKR